MYLEKSSGANENPSARPDLLCDVLAQQGSLDCKALLRREEHSVFCVHSGQGSFKSWQEKYKNGGINLVGLWRNPSRYVRELTKAQCLDRQHNAKCAFVALTRSALTDTSRGTCWSRTRC